MPEELNLLPCPACDGKAVFPINFEDVLIQIECGCGCSGHREMTSAAPQILDPCCGGRMFWFNKADPRAMFCDIRAEEHVLCDGRVFNVRPDTVADFRALPFADASFRLICFDPPHLERAGEDSWMRKKYGALNALTWSEDLSKGFNECWRVLKPGGTLIFKWNETQIPIRRVLECFSQRPTFGHTTTTNLKTHWVVFYKAEQRTSIDTLMRN